MTTSSSTSSKGTGLVAADSAPEAALLPEQPLRSSEQSPQTIITTSDAHATTRTRRVLPPQQDFALGNSIIPPGTRMVVDIPFGKLYTHTELNIGAHVIHGKKAGPVLLITAALHGDEINGVEICR
jgi:hypothetical protein